MAALRNFLAFVALVAAPLVLDAVCGYLSKAVGIPYRWFAPVDILLYASIGFGFAWYGSSWFRGVAATALAAASDVSVGWYESLRMGVGDVIQDTTVKTFYIIGVWLFLTALGSGAAFVAGLLRARRAR